MHSEKPVVRYTSAFGVAVGQRAWLSLADDHPVLGQTSAIDGVSTSTVKFYDPETGVIETQNTIYTPE